MVSENGPGYLPLLKTVIDGPDQYDFVFVGFPTWYMKLPLPMKSFLRQYSFQVTTIIPFNSNGGYGPGSTSQTVRELCPRSIVLQGFSTQGKDPIFKLSAELYANHQNAKIAGDDQTVSVIRVETPDQHLLLAFESGGMMLYG